MCLSTVKERFKNPSGSGIGWKLFEKTEDKKLRFIFAHHYTSCKFQKITVGKWMTSSNGKSKDTVGVCEKEYQYETGFHIYKTRDIARRMRVLHGSNGKAIRKVKYKNVTAIGTQEGDHIIVAKNMLIMKE